MALLDRDGGGHAGELVGLLMPRPREGPQRAQLLLSQPLPLARRHVRRWLQGLHHRGRVLPGQHLRRVELRRIRGRHGVSLSGASLARAAGGSEWGRKLGGTSRGMMQCEWASGGCRRQGDLAGSNGTGRKILQNAPLNWIAVIIRNPNIYRNTPDLIAIRLLFS